MSAFLAGKVAAKGGRRGEGSKTSDCEVNQLLPDLVRDGRITVQGVKRHRDCPPSSVLASFTVSFAAAASFKGRARIPRR